MKRIGVGKYRLVGMFENLYGFLLAAISLLCLLFEVAVARSAYLEYGGWLGLVSFTGDCWRVLLSGAYDAEWLLVAFLIAVIVVHWIIFAFVIIWFWILMRGELLLDQEWDRFYIYPIMIMLFPTGWLLLLTNWIRGAIRERRRLREDSLRGKELAERQRVELDFALKNFPHNRGGAQIAYEKLCEERRREDLNERRDQAKETKRKAEEALWNAQIEERKARRQLKSADNMLSRLNPKDFAARSREEIAKDFERLMEIRGVERVYADVDGSLHLRVDVRVSHCGGVYDFGDWEVVIYSQRQEKTVGVRRLRSGVLPTWESGSFPDYSIVSGSGGTTFRFAGRVQEIRDHLRAGELLRGITMIVAHLHRVDDLDDRRKIPLCFRRAEECDVSSTDSTSR